MEWIQLFVFIVLLLILSIPLGSYMAAVFQEKKIGFVENSIYKILGVDPQLEMEWTTYAKAMLFFNLIGFLFLFCLQLLQGWLPFNPQNLPGVEPAQAFNTAVSFVTNTNWQSYAGENTMSYTTQMLGLAVQNFLSAATGNAVLIALIRGISRKTAATIGNFWVDLTKTILYILLPLSIISALIFVSQGVPQNFSPYVKAETLSGKEQMLPMGPVASQIAIKQLGTNGGGYFNTNSAHPYENPTPLSNFLENFLILLIPAATVFMFGKLIKSKGESRVIFSVMLFLWLAGLGISLYSEHLDNPAVGVNPVLEGKETRFGIDNSILWAISTTGTSNGSVNTMHSSLSPLAGGMALFNIMLGEVIFGGVGVGLCGMIMFILLTVFLAGLMVGRTPEYLGKKIEKSEMQWVMLAVLAPCGLILIGSGIAAILPVALESLGNSGPHGLTEILYAFSSSSGNNGSAFAGLNANTYFYNIILALVMLFARLAILIPSLAVAGSLARKRAMAPSLGTFETDSLLFGIVLVAVIFIVGALTFFPALSLGPLVEQLLMLKGRAF